MQPSSDADATRARGTALGAALAQLLSGDAAGCIASCAEIIGRSPREPLPWLVRGRAFVALGAGAGARGALIQAELHFDRVIALARASVARHSGSVAGRDTPGSSDHASDAIAIEALRAARREGGGGTLLASFPSAALASTVGGALVCCCCGRGSGVSVESSGSGSRSRLATLVAALSSRDALMCDVASAGGLAGGGGVGEPLTALGVRAVSGKALAIAAIDAAPDTTSPPALEAVWAALITASNASSAHPTPRSHGWLDTIDVLVRDATTLANEGSLGSAIVVAMVAAVAALRGSSNGSSLSCGVCVVFESAAAELVARDGGGVDLPLPWDQSTPWSLARFATECAACACGGSGRDASSSVPLEPRAMHLAGVALASLASAAGSLSGHAGRHDAAAVALRAIAIAAAKGALALAARR